VALAKVAARAAVRLAGSWRDKGIGACVEHGEGMKLILEVGLGRFESYRSDHR